MRAACVGWRVLPDAAVASASVVQRPPRVPVRFVRVPGAERREQSGGSRAEGAERARSCGARSVLIVRARADCPGRRETVGGF